ncbi:MFS transporter [Cohnella luojiensis]|uniref:MFS transporter n=1 Tax=Cohnella luojiensis TaxID=652876 RepID=A0A4Y8LNR2_9BACL|nr:MFS transporter [Cohnella luojiensis]TFE22597.1 MFS transporter [Cohnella luojiensis]
MFTLGFVKWDQPWWVVLLLSFASTGIGAALSSFHALITEGIDKKQRGTVTSLYSSMRFIGVASGPPISALLMQH